MNLLVTQINHVGDAIVFLPTIKGLLQASPDIKITLISSSETADIYRRAFPEIEVLDRPFREFRRWRGILTARRIAKQLAGRRFEYSVHGYDSPLSAYLVSRLMGVRQSVGFRSGINIGERLLGTSLPYSEERNTVDLCFELARHFAERQVEPKRIPFPYSAEELQTAIRALAAVNVNPDEKFVLIHPYANFYFKQWGENRYVSFARRLETELGVPVFFDLGREKPQHPFHHKSIWGLSLFEVAALCNLASLYVGNNSGIMHIASSVCTSTVTICGPTSPRWDVFWNDAPHIAIRAENSCYAPCLKNANKLHQCLNTQTPYQCMRSVSEETVLEAALKVLNEGQTTIAHPFKTPSNTNGMNPGRAG